MPLSLIPFLLLVIPILEIAVFIMIGDQIGVLWTLGLIVITAIIGSILLRVQGFGLLTQIQSEVRDGGIPARNLVHGVMILIAGVLLLTPGFVTDSMGFLLFVPPVRDIAWKLLKSRISVVSFGSGHQTRRDGQQETKGATIDLDDEDFVREPDSTSPWSDDETK